MGKSFRESVIDKLVEFEARYPITHREIAEELARIHARLIAEAVKPLRDALRDIVDDAIKMTAGDGDYYYACGLVYVDAASALLNSESVKTPIEAQLEEEIKPRRFWFCPKCRGFMEAPDGTGLTVCAKGHDMTRCVPAYLTRADFESVKTNEETT